MAQATHDEHHGVVLTTTEARQGETSGHVRVILGTSMVLALIAFLVLYGSAW